MFIYARKFPPFKFRENALTRSLHLNTTTHTYYLKSHNIKRWLYVFVLQILMPGMPQDTWRDLMFMFNQILKRFHRAPSELHETKFIYMRSLTRWKVKGGKRRGWLDLSTNSRPWSTLNYISSAANFIIIKRSRRTMKMQIMQII